MTVLRTSTLVGVGYEARAADGTAWAVEHLLPRQGTTQASVSFTDGR